MPQLAERISRLKASPIREILAVIERPGMISFAGGLPAGDSFVTPDLTAMPVDCLQYGPSEGESGLRARIATELRALGLHCRAEQVLILSGSQQGIDLVAKLMIEDGTRVALENPTYLAALQVFSLFGARYLGFTPQAPGALANGKPALCYTIPTFQNPTGHCYTRQERMALAEQCSAHDILLFEDDPYRDLVYEPCERQPVCSFMEKGLWVYQGSFSKSHAPGLRLGFLACAPDLITPLTRLKQAADLHSSRVAQYWILRQLQDPGREQRLEQVRALYRTRRDAFAAALDETLGAKAQWELPQGGLFFWLKLNDRIDTTALLQKAIERGVAFMPGEAFFHHPPQDGANYLRLNFSHAGEAEMQRGLSLLAELLV